MFQGFSRFLPAVILLRTQRREPLQLVLKTHSRILLLSFPLLNSRRLFLVLFSHFVVSNIKRTVTCIRSKETGRFHHQRSRRRLPETLRAIVHIQRLRWQILDQRCDSGAFSRNVGSKMLVVLLFFFCCCFFFPRRNFRPGNQTYPRQRGHWSSMFPLNFLPTVGKKQELEMLEWNTCSGWLHYHIWSIATALKRASGVLQNENARGPEQAPWGTPKAEHSYLFSAKEPLSAFLDALLSTPMSL